MNGVIILTADDNGKRVPDICMAANMTWTDQEEILKPDKERSEG